MDDGSLESRPQQQQDKDRDQPQKQHQPRTTSEEEPGRVWRACLECRKKKNKCDGKPTCKPCTTRNRECVYPETNDNASTSRRLSSTIEARCQQLDALCQKMETMMGNLSETVETFSTTMNQHPQAQRLYTPTTGVSALTPWNLGMFNQELFDELSFPAGSSHPQLLEPPILHPDGESDDRESSDGLPENIGKNVVDHIMATDSYGKLRYVGGTYNMVMIEALKSLSPSSVPETSPAESGGLTENSNSLELPFFSGGHTWPRLQSLARAEQLPRPPRYISDLLVNIYFEQLHYTMPVIYQPHFMQRYKLLLSAGSSTNIDAGFLSVFFAVCTCAAGLLPRDASNSTIFTGLQYYESAISLHYASTGEGTIEQVQCLALLSMCSAGWNTLAQSWKFAGQAVRAAQDLGLHRSPARGTGELLKEELCRRIWWSVYGLDRVLSNCLGRPVGIEDSDCDCEMPLDMEDGDLEVYCKQGQPLTSKVQGPSRLTGFIVFSKLCQISGHISRATSFLTLRHNKANQPKQRLLREAIRELDIELTDWLQNIPDVIKFSANNSDTASAHLTMCVISYVLHAGCVVNLHRPLIPEGYNALTSPTEDPSYLQCVNAARSCIQIAELVKENVPPSHHLAYCIHYLALSGIFLFQNLSAPDAIENVETCIRYLADLESLSIGAHRSRVIIEELLKRAKGSQNFKRPYSELEDFNIADFTMMQDLFPGIN